MRPHRSFPVPTLARASLLICLLGGGPWALPLPVSADAPAQSATPELVVDINTATAEELERLPGVGPSRARAIVEQRERRPFTRVEELMRVRGIGRATFRALRPHLTVSAPPSTPARARRARP